MRKRKKKTGHGEAKNQLSLGGSTTTVSLSFPPISSFFLFFFFLFYSPLPDLHLPPPPPPPSPPPSPPPPPFFSCHPCQLIDSEEENKPSDVLWFLSRSCLTCCSLNQEPSDVLQLRVGFERNRS